MDLWYYDKENRRRGPFDITGITDLVNKGVIVPETIIESDTGRRVRAARIPNLRFPVPQAVREGLIPPPLPPRIGPEKQQPDNSGTIFPGPYPGDVSANSPDHSQPSQGGPGPQGENPFNEAPTPPTGSGIITEEPANKPSADARPDKALPTDEIQYITDQKTWKKKGGFWAWLLDLDFTRIGILYHYRSLTSIVYRLSIFVAIVALFGFFVQAGINSFDLESPWYGLAIKIPLVGLFSALIYLFVLVVIRCCLEFGILLVDYLVTTTRAARKYLDSHHEEP